MSFLKLSAGLPKKVPVLTEVAIMDTPTANQGIFPEPNMKSEKDLFLPERTSPSPADKARYPTRTNQSSVENAMEL